MNEGVLGSALILATASRNVAATSLLACLLSPMWLSLICTKLNSAPAAAPAASEAWLRVCDLRIPPVMVQRTPVPAHAMHLRKPRRSMPSLSSLCVMMSSILDFELSLLTYVERNPENARGSRSSIQTVDGQFLFPRKNLSCWE